MGLFDRRERELELEVKELKESVSLLEVRLKNEKKNSSELLAKIDKQNNVIEQQNLELKTQRCKHDKLEQLNEKYESGLVRARDALIEHKEKISELNGKVICSEKSNKRLKKENARLKVKPKSNAGRKSKINDDVIKQTEKLKSENKSLMQIANELEISTGVAYSKSTIKNIIDNYIKDRSMQK